MDCRETRDEIEKIEDLKKKDHAVPEGIASHLNDCENCDEYHRASGDLERLLFSKIKDLKVPPVPRAAAFTRTNPSKWHRLLFFVPLAAAAAVLIIMGLTSYDFTGDIFEKAVAHSLGIEKAYAEEIDQSMRAFREATGLAPSLPEELQDLKPEKACLLDIRGRKALAFFFRRNGQVMHVFVYPGQYADWKCCRNSHCTCLSTAAAAAERWKKGALGYMIITPGKTDNGIGDGDETRARH